MKKQIAVFIFLACFVTFSSVFAQTKDELCNSKVLNSALDEYIKDIEDASYEETQQIAESIEALLDRYLEECFEEATDSQATNTEIPTTITEDLFSVKAIGIINIRSCGDTSCDIVATSTDGQIYSVIGQDGDWYEVELEDGSRGFIAAWLTVRGPDEIIDIYAGFADDTITCGLIAVVSRSSSRDLDFAISGSTRQEILVDIYRPNANDPEPVQQQYDKTFVDTGEPYIHQVYRSSNWPDGSYQISIDRDDLPRRVYGFDLNQSGDTTIFVICN